MYLFHQIAFIIKKEKITDTHKNLDEAPEDNVA